MTALTIRALVSAVVISSLLNPCLGVYEKSSYACDGFRSFGSSCNTKSAYVEEHEFSASECQTRCKLMDGLCVGYQVPSPTTDTRKKLKKCMIITSFRGDKTGADPNYSCYEHKCPGEAVCYSSKPGRCKAPKGWKVVKGQINGLASCAEICKYTHDEEEGGVCQGFQWRKGKCLLFVNPEAEFDDSSPYRNDLTANSRDRKSQCFTKDAFDCTDDSEFDNAYNPPGCTVSRSETRLSGKCRSNVKLLGVFKIFRLPREIYAEDRVERFCSDFCNIFDELCLGYEYQPSIGLCEIHFASIDYSAPFGNGRECIKRTYGAAGQCWSSKSGLGFCRTPEGSSGKPEFCKSCTSITACRSACLVRSDCRAFEWHEGKKKPRCEIHTSPISYTQPSTSRSIPLCYIKK